MSPRNTSRILVTGAAGFMGSAFVRYLFDKGDFEKVVSYDLLTKAGKIENLSPVTEDPRHLFVKGDICNGPLVEELIRTHNIDTIVHFAAESHVDTSIANPKLFFRTNVEGTLTLLEIVRRFPKIHFHHISTDEVYGSIEEGTFSEESPYRPNSPYAASKASSDHICRSYFKTYGCSITISHASNNYGPCQHEEKFIPKMISHCLAMKKLPIYGTGAQVREWLFVEDHADAVWTIVNRGKGGESYNIGSQNNWRNIDLLHFLIEKVAKKKGESRELLEKLISFAPDRPGHDFRYALSSKKLKDQLGWEKKFSFEEGIEKTVEWYV